MIKHTNPSSNGHAELNCATAVFKVHSGFQNFIAKNHLSDDFCNIFVSDFKHIWYKSMTENELFSICQSLNPLFEGPVKKLRDITLNLLKDVSVKKEIKEEENSSIFLRLESNIMGVKFQFQVLLNQGDGELFYKELTVPLLLVLMNTQSREKKLIEIIKEKDKEIEDYRQEYGLISNPLATNPFNIKEFDFQETSSNIPWDRSSFLDCISAKVLSFEPLPKIKSEDKLFEQKLDIRNTFNNDTKASMHKQKILKPNESKPCILLNNQIIKKRKKQNEEFKIKI